jgi:hypothetical protein
VKCTRDVNWKGREGQEKLSSKRRDGLEGPETMISKSGRYFGEWKPKSNKKTGSI